MNKFYITTPIFYPNSKLHLGHAYVTILADIFNRYHKAIGDATYFVTGADEHSIKVVKSAEKANESVEVYTQKIATGFKELFNNLSVEYDYFVRTSDKNTHWDGAIKLWNKLIEKGDIYKKKYSGKYCIGCESFIKNSDLINGFCPFHDEIPQIVEEENYFFRLSKYQDQLLELISQGVVNVMSDSSREEVISFIRGGLLDVSFSRPITTNSWAIPIPEDPEQGMYVWCDALSSYITSIGYASDSEKFNTYWPADCHLIGKDILRFHAVTWIAMLLSADLPLPKNIIVHGLLLSDGRKMSKTLGNVINPELLIEKYGSEMLRYFFARHVPIFSDGEISVELFNEACKSNLLNGLGNLVSRVLGMAIMYGSNIERGPAFLGVISNSEYAWYKEYFDSFQINQVTNKIWELISGLDKKITVDEPFKVARLDRESAKEMVNSYLVQVWNITQLLKPILPKTVQKIESAFDKKEKVLIFDKSIFEK